MFVTARDHPPPGGEPLWRVSDEPAIYSLQRFIRPQNVAADGSRELPNVMLYPWLFDSFTSGA
jgi:hypothetical protein